MGGARSAGCGTVTALSGVDLSPLLFSQPSYACVLPSAVLRDDLRSALLALSFHCAWLPWPCSSDTNFACWSPPLWDFPSGSALPKETNRQVAVSVVVSNLDGSETYTVTKSNAYWYDRDRTP